MYAYEAQVHTDIPKPTGRISESMEDAFDRLILLALLQVPKGQHKSQAYEETHGCAKSHGIQ